ncbi:MAG TPA: GNAT family N-acetyltransferase, partial [Acidimicrobiales bacterium]|nr:GNAT family N-acetyltransferase [Acidimicrobiales bacterium]
EKMAETRAGPVMLGPIRDEELSALFDLFADIVARGDGFPHEPPLTAEMFAATWVDTVSAVVVARLEQIVAGAYYLKPNFVGRAAHIANAGYVVSPAYRRSGIGRVLVEDSIWRAPLHGFDAVQFNLVFTSNPARVLYEELGWQVVGTLPRAVDGEDCLVYWRAVGRGS